MLLKCSIILRMGNEFNIESNVSENDTLFNSVINQWKKYLTDFNRLKKNELQHSLI